MGPGPFLRKGTLVRDHGFPNLLVLWERIVFPGPDRGCVSGNEEKGGHFIEETERRMFSDQGYTHVSRSRRTWGHDFLSPEPRGPTV